MFDRKSWYWQADGTAGAGEPQTVEPKPEPVAEDFDAWLEKQPEEVKGKFSDKYGKLAETLEKERKTNKENSKFLKRLAELEAEEEKRKSEALTNEQRLQALVEDERKKRQDAETVLQNERIRTTVLMEAGKSQFGEKKTRFINPEEAEVFIKQYGEIEIEDGKVKGVSEALQKLAKEKPHLLEQLPAPKGGGSPVTGKKVVSQESTPLVPIPRF